MSLLSGTCSKLRLFVQGDEAVVVRGGGGGPEIARVSSAQRSAVVSSDT